MLYNVLDKHEYSKQIVLRSKSNIVLLEETHFAPSHHIFIHSIKSVRGIFGTLLLLFRYPRIQKCS